MNQGEGLHAVTFFQVTGACLSSRDFRNSLSSVTTGDLETKFLISIFNASWPVLSSFMLVCTLDFEMETAHNRDMRLTGEFHHSDDVWSNQECGLESALVAWLFEQGQTSREGHSSLLLLASLFGQNECLSRLRWADYLLPDYKTLTGQETDRRT